MLGRSKPGAFLPVLGHAWVIAMTSEISTNSGAPIVMIEVETSSRS
jgi:hypothetical protein